MNQRPRVRFNGSNSGPLTRLLLDGEVKGQVQLAVRVQDGNFIL